MNHVFQNSMISKVYDYTLDKGESETDRKRSCLPGPLIPGRRLLFRFPVSCALSTREQMYSVFAFRCVQPFVFVAVLTFSSS